jgi:hypothetical protein
MPGRSVTPMEIDALLVTSATLVAMIEYTPALEGATYVAETEVTLVNVPQEAPEQPAPDANQVIPAARTSFCTVAETGRVCVIVRPPRLGEMLILIAAGEPTTVIFAEAFLAVFEMEVAVRVTVAEFATFGGAV